MSLDVAQYAAATGTFTTPATSFTVSGIDTTGTTNLGLIMALLYPTASASPTVTFNGKTSTVISAASLVDYSIELHLITDCGAAAANILIDFNGETVNGLICHAIGYEGTNTTNAEALDSADSSNSASYSGALAVSYGSAAEVFGVVGAFRTGATVTITNPVGFTQIASTANLIISTDRLSMRTFYRRSEVSGTFAPAGSITPARPWGVLMAEIIPFEYATAGGAAPPQYLGGT